MKYCLILLLAISFSSCSLVSRQTYYVPDKAQRVVNGRQGYFKVMYSSMKITGPKGDSIGFITTSNGIGALILAGPPFLPVIPVGLADIFYKRNHLFLLDLDVQFGNGYFMPLAIDSNGYKTTSDSLKKLKIMTAARLNNSRCYMIVNGRKQVQLKTEQFFMGYTTGQQYRLFADVRFKSVKTMQLFTGNKLLDSALSNVTFKRRHRITYCIMGGS